MRRIEALTGPEAVDLLRAHDRALAEAADGAASAPERVPELVAQQRDRLREAERAARQGGGRNGVDVDRSFRGRRARRMPDPGDAVQAPDGKALLDVADRLKNKLGDAVIVLGSAGDDRVDLIATVAPSLVSRGVRAGELVKIAAAVVGGGGGGRDTMARAGGRDVQASRRDRGRASGETMRGGACVVRPA